MYIEPFVFGFICGVIAGSFAMIAAAVIATRRDKER